MITSRTRRGSAVAGMGGTETVAATISRHRCRQARAGMESLTQVIASGRSDVRPGGWFKPTDEGQTRSVAPSVARGSPFGLNELSCRSRGPVVRLRPHPLPDPITVTSHNRCAQRARSRCQCTASWAMAPGRYWSRTVVPHALASSISRACNLTTRSQERGWAAPVPAACDNASSGRAVIRHLGAFNRPPQTVPQPQPQTAGFKGRIRVSLTAALRCGAPGPLVGGYSPSARRRYPV
jgi:hypothetical protein